jgi:hypothetical protein
MSTGSEVLSAILDEKSRKVHDLVESFIASPMELWRFFHIFTNLLHLPGTHLTCFTSALHTHTHTHTHKLWRFFHIFTNSSTSQALTLLALLVHTHLLY